MQWSKKQQETINWPRSDDRLLICDGAIRTGKSQAAAVAFVNQVLRLPDGVDAALFAPSINQLRGIMLTYIRRHCEANAVPFIRHRSYTAQGSFAQVNGHKVYSFPIETVDSEEQFMGFTLGAAWVDEVIGCDRKAVEQVFSRLSVPGAKAIWTTNPAGAAHWVKVDYIDQKRPGQRRISWQLSDAPWLPADFIADTDGWAREKRAREVFGQWVSADGLIYPDMAIDQAGGNEDRLVVGLDPAIATVSHAVMIAYTREPRRAVVIDEWRHDAERDGLLSHHDQAGRFCEWLGDRDAPVYVDPADPGMVAALRDREVRAYSAEGDRNVLRNIRNVQRWFAKGWLSIAPSCSETIREVGGYHWDSRAAQRGEDKPDKVNDHAADALGIGVRAIQRGHSVRTRHLFRAGSDTRQVRSISAPVRLSRGGYVPA